MASANNGGHEPCFRPGQRRTRPMQVLALGLPRTGTRSMSAALEILGYSHCAHGFDMLDDPAYTARLEAAVNAKYFNSGKPFTVKEWDELLGHCSAVTDVPLVLFWKELTVAYPDAKVVLVQRDEDKWFKSFCQSVIDNMFSTSGQFTRRVVEPLLGSRLGPLSMKTLIGMLGAEDEAGMKSNARAVYRRHYEDIENTLPADKILKYKLGSGWQPLCAFLQRPVPTEDFPWINESEALQEKVDGIQKQMATKLQRSLIKWGLPAVGTVLAVVWYAWA